MGFACPSDGSTGLFFCPKYIFSQSHQNTTKCKTHNYKYLDKVSLFPFFVTLVLIPPFRPIGLLFQLHINGAIPSNQSAEAVSQRRASKEDSFGANTQKSRFDNKHENMTKFDSSGRSVLERVLPNRCC
jgi:hypothetical protein